MVSEREEFEYLFRTSEEYREWFKRWWSEDFSIAGRNARFATNSHIRRAEFAGRTWPKGWAPPHDLKGLTNPDFQFLGESSAQTYWWSIVQEDLRGSYLAGGGPEYISSSAHGMAFCFFAQDVIITPRVHEFDIANSFSTGNVTFAPERQTKLSAAGIRISKSLHIKSSRSISYDISDAIIKGNFSAEGSQVDGLAHRARVSGRLDVKGGFSAEKLRANDVSFAHVNSTKGPSEIRILGARLRSVSASGPYQALNMDGAKIQSVKLSVEAARNISCNGATFVDLEISGEIDSVTADKVRISKTASFTNLKSKQIRISNSTLGDLSVEDSISSKFNMDGVAVKRRTTFRNCQFADSFSAVAAVFEGHASFAKNALPGLVDFSGANFSRGADFRVGSGGIVTTLAAFKQMGEASFAAARFEPGKGEVCVNFDGREMLEAANFEMAVFNGVPKFYECEFHENVSFRGARFNIISPKETYARAVVGLSWRAFVLEVRSAIQRPKSLLTGARRAWDRLRAPLRERRAAENRRLAEYERAYNALRQRSADVGNAKYERQFHNSELRARRRRVDADAPLIEGVVSRVYDLFSEYGQSISRPLAILAIVVWLGFGVVYFFMAGEISLNGVLESGVFSARQIVKPFSAWSRDFALAATPVVAPSPNNAASWIEDLFLLNTSLEVARSTLIRFLATIQSLLSVVLLFLSGLAIRRTFGVG